jgi:hypothetical protein
MGPLDDSRKCPGGYYCPTKTNDYVQNLCTPGYYCPIGATAMVVCDVGHFCSEYGLTEPSGVCEAGYICIAGSIKPNPDDGGITGIQCPAGYYCPAGSCPTGSTNLLCTLPTSVLQTACPDGTYNDKFGASDNSFCLTCPSNKQCSGLAQTAPGTNCAEGFYCQTVNGIT